MDTARRQTGAGARGRCRILAVLLLVGFVGGGCLFSTRDPKEPAGEGEEVRYENPEVKFLALGNMERALEAKQLTNYERSFADQVEMKLSDEDEQFYNSEEEFPNWSAGKEGERMQRILDNTSASLNVEWYFTPDQPDSVSESATVEYYQELGYRLTFTQGGQTAATKFEYRTSKSETMPQTENASMT